MDLYSKVSDYIENFQFVQGETWLTHMAYPIGLSIGYVIVVFLIKSFMSHRKDENGKALPALKLKGFSALHNAILCVWSIAMFCGFLVGFVREFKALGWPIVYCCVLPDAPNDTYTRGPLVFWSYIYYLSKYYEFIDTCILALKNRPLIFLHVWHHAIMPLCSMAWIFTGYPHVWVPCGLNSFIHIILYAYYAASALGIYSRIRRYITSMQIVQFMLGLSQCTIWYFHILVRKQPCVGERYGMFFTYLVCLSFLVLFIKFYIDEYIEGKRLTGGKGALVEGKEKKEGKAIPAVTETSKPKAQ